MPLRRCRLLFVLIASLLTAAAARAEPALWAARSATATVYLFGTVHVLPPGTEWQTAKIRQAFDAAGDLWLEVPDIGNIGAQQQLVMRYGLDPSHPLSSKLPKQDISRIDAALRQMGQQGGEAAVEPLRPWLVGMMLSLAPVQAAGLDPASGVDVVLNAQAAKAGKQVIGLETNEQQIRFFAGMTPKDEAEFVESVLTDVNAGPDKLRAMVAAWLAGDVAALTKLAIEEDQYQAPELYRTMFVNRNTAWAAKLAERLKGSGVSFVAVGAGHLAGPDSVQMQLQKLGVPVTRE